MIFKKPEGKIEEGKEWATVLQQSWRFSIECLGRKKKSNCKYEKKKEKRKVNPLGTTSIQVGESTKEEPELRCILSII